MSIAIQHLIPTETFACTVHPSVHCALPLCQSTFSLVRQISSDRPILKKAEFHFVKHLAFYYFNDIH